MKALCDRDKLREALAVANNVVPTKSPKPILSNVCLVATGDALEVVATDMDVALRYRIEDGVKVEEPGTTVVPARVLLEFVRDLTDPTVSLDANEHKCRVESGPDSCELVVSDPDEFPVVARFEEQGALSLQAGTFTTLVGRTAFAAAREQGRYAMNGVLVEIQDGELRFVATDGRRLAMASAPIDAPASNGTQRKDGPQERPTIVPTRGMSLFCRVLVDSLDQIKLSIADNQVGLKTSCAEAFARLVDGEFPRYGAVIPRDCSRSLEADAATFGRKLRLVSNVTGDDARAVRLSLSRDHLEIFGQSAGKGTAKASMDVQFKGDDAEIAFNPDYVLEGLKNCERSEVRLEFSERHSPGKFTLGENYLYVVMPITIDT
jgi:DNA polymerase-3 subunit beta